MSRALPVVAGLVIVGAVVAVAFLTGGNGPLRGPGGASATNPGGASGANPGGASAGGGESASNDPSSMAGATEPGPAPICAPGPAGDSCRSGHRPKPPRGEAEIRARLLDRDRELVAVREEIASTKARSLRATGADRERLRARVRELITRQQGLEQEVSGLQARLQIRPTVQRDAGPP